MSSHTKAAVAFRRLCRSVDEGNVGQVRALLRANKFDLTEDLVSTALQGKPAAVLTALLEAGAPCERVLRREWDTLTGQYRRHVRNRGGFPDQWKLEALLRHAKLNEMRPSLLFEALYAPALIALLLKHGADANCFAANGESLLCQALRRDGEEVVLALLDAGARPEAMVNGDFVGGSNAAVPSALQLAVARQADSVVLRIARSPGMDVNELLPRSPNTLLCTVVSMGRQGLVQPLLDGGADPNLGEPSAMQMALRSSLADACWQMARCGGVLQPCHRETPCVVSLHALLLLMDVPTKSASRQQLCQRNNWKAEDYEKHLQAEIKKRMMKAKLQ